MAPGRDDLVVDIVDSTGKIDGAAPSGWKQQNRVVDVVEIGGSGDTDASTSPFRVDPRLIIRIAEDGDTGAGVGEDLPPWCLDRSIDGQGDAVGDRQHALSLKVEGNVGRDGNAAGHRTGLADHQGGLRTADSSERGIQRRICVRNPVVAEQVCDGAAEVADQALRAIVQPDDFAFAAGRRQAGFLRRRHNRRRERLVRQRLRLIAGRQRLHRRPVVVLQRRAIPLHFTGGRWIRPSVLKDRLLQACRRNRQGRRADIRIVRNAEDVQDSRLEVLNDGVQGAGIRTARRVGAIYFIWKADSKYLLLDTRIVESACALKPKKFNFYSLRTARLTLRGAVVGSMSPQPKRCARATCRLA